MAKRAMPKFTKAPPELVATFDRVTDLSGVEHRKMFGYPAAFAGGNMFASLFQSSMILRLSAEDREAFARRFQAQPFEPMPGRPMREYLEVPAAVLASPKQLREWVDRALAYAASLPAKGKSSGAKRRRKA